VVRNEMLKQNFSIQGSIPKISFAKRQWRNHERADTDEVTIVAILKSNIKTKIGRIFQEAVHQINKNKEFLVK